MTVGLQVPQFDRLWPWAALWGLPPGTMTWLDLTWQQGTGMAPAKWSWGQAGNQHKIIKTFKTYLYLYHLFLLLPSRPSPPGSWAPDDAFDCWRYTVWTQLKRFGEILWEAPPSKAKVGEPYQQATSEIGSNAPIKPATVPKPKGFKWVQLGERIVLRPLTFRARVKSDRNAQIARWSVVYFWPAKLDSGNIPQKSKYKK